MNIGELLTIYQDQSLIQKQQKNNFPHHIFFEQAKTLNGDHLLLDHTELSILTYLAKSFVSSQQKILELGSFVGRTACYLATHQFNIDSIEKDLKAYHYCLENQKNLSLTSIRFIHSRIQNCLESLLNQESYGLFFIDADKSSYLEYYKIITSKKPLLPSFRLLIFDNIYLNGTIKQEVTHIMDSNCIFSISPEYQNSKRAIKKISWSYHIQSKILNLCSLCQSEFESALIDTSDGMLLIKI